MPSTAQEVSLDDINYLHNVFVLSGNPNSPYWFLGPEAVEHPGPSESVDHFMHSLLHKAKRFETSGTVSLRDIYGGDTDTYLPEIIEASAQDTTDTTYHTTWGGYIKLLLSLDQARHDLPGNWDLDDIKRYQKNYLGSLESRDNIPDACIMELFPMAREGRKRGRWPYSALDTRDGLEFFASAKHYLEYATSRRTRVFLDAVQKHQPEYLFCFGGDCKKAVLPHLQAEHISLSIPTKNKDAQVQVVEHGATKFVFSCHPTSSATSDHYWTTLGKKLAQLGGDTLATKAA